MITSKFVHLWHALLSTIKDPTCVAAGSVGNKRYINVLTPLGQRIVRRYIIEQSLMNSDSKVVILLMIMTLLSFFTYLIDGIRTD